MGGGSRIRYSIKNVVLICDSISEKSHAATFFIITSHCNETLSTIVSHINVHCMISGEAIYVTTFTCVDSINLTNNLFL